MTDKLDKVEKAIDISKVKLGDIIKGLHCPKCKDKSVRLVGLYHREEKSHEVECMKCCYTERVNPKQVEFRYEPPKEPKKKKSEVEDND